MYWRRNIRCVLLLLGVWFFVSYGCSILFVDSLNQIQIPGTGYRLGFWMAVQGSMYVFVVLIGIYVWYMNRLDKEFLRDSAGGDGGAGSDAGEKQEQGGR
ncbi:MAG: DUF4212 domain-containing protein [Verrucomicrobiales bacterium]